MRSIHWQGCFMIALLAACSAGQVRPGFPIVKADQMWIESIPSGQMCYLAKAGTTRGPDDVFTDVNKKGKTPLLLTLEPGGYEIGLLVATGSNPDAEFGPRFNARLGHAFGSIPNNDYVVFFDVLKQRDKPDSFIGLAFSSEASADAVAKLYPQGTNFQFDEQNVRATLADRGVNAAETESGIKLLRRGGKVLFTHKSSAKKPTTIEIKVGGSIEVVPQTVK